MVSVTAWDNTELFAFADEPDAVRAGAVGTVTHAQHCTTITSRRRLEGDRDGAARIRGEGRTTIVVFDEIGGVIATDSCAQGDTACLIVGDGYVAGLILLTNWLRSEERQLGVYQQVVELKGADIAEIVAIGETVIATLINAAEAGWCRRRADRIVALIDRRTAELQGDGLGWSPVILETAGI